MFLQAVLERNPALAAFAADAVAQGRMSPGTFVVDLEAVESNAALIATAARRHGLALYFMAKQLGRHPDTLRRIAAHIPKAVAVNLDDVRALVAVGIAVGHIGHLVQPGLRELGFVLEADPEVVTVFSAEMATAIAAIAQERRVEVHLLARVQAHGDRFYPGQEGGIEVEDLPAFADHLSTLPGVQLEGVTSYPCFEPGPAAYEPTPNARTLRRAAELLPELRQFNGPGHSCVGIVPLASELGITHLEPGHALTGTTPLHATQRRDEVPAVVFASEVSHRRGDGNYSIIGSGTYPRGHERNALAFTTAGEVMGEVLPHPPTAIDYYRTLLLDGPARVGDPVVLAFRFQAFVTRAPIAGVMGLPD